MNKKTYSGAYFRRRYSNASSTSLGNSTHSSPGGNGGGSTVNIVLSVNNASMGSINATLLPSANQNHQQGEVVINRDGTKTLTVARGSTVRVVAKANTGYVLQNFTGTPTPPDTPTAAFDVVANTDCNFTAVFRQASTPVYHNVTVVYNSTMGNVTTPGLAPEPGYPDSNGTMHASMSVQYGNSVTLVATPKAGYRFVRWEGCIIAGKPNMTVSNHQVVQQIFSDRTLYAVFAPEGGNPGGGGSSETPSGGGGNTINKDPINPNPVNPTPNPVNPVYPVNPVNPNGGDITGKAVAFAKKWWWAILIVGYIAYKEMKGGRR